MLVHISSACPPAVSQIQLNLHGRLYWPFSFYFILTDRNSTNLTYQALPKAHVNVY